MEKEEMKIALEKLNQELMGTRDRQVANQIETVLCELQKLYELMEKKIWA